MSTPVTVKLEAKTATISRAIGGDLIQHTGQDGG